MSVRSGDTEQAFGRWENKASPQGALTPAGSDHLPLSKNERG